MTLIAYVFPKLRTANNMVRKMSKNSRFRTPFDKQHGKRSQTLLKSARQHLDHIYCSLWKKLSWKKHLLVICKILRKKQKLLWKSFFLHFWNQAQFLNILKKKMTLIIYLFPELRTANNVVRWQTIPNTLEICTVAPLPYLLISVKEIELGKFSLSVMQNLKTVC